MQENSFDNIKEINLIDSAARNKVLTDTICKGEQSNLKSTIKQIAITITAFYRRRFPDATADKCNEIVTDNPIIRQVTFTNLVRSRYLIAAPLDASIISMFGHGACSVKIRASNQREIDVLLVESDNNAKSQIRIRNPLPAIAKVNLLTLDNVFIYTDIIKDFLIMESQANLLQYFPIPSHF